jgi:dTDP-glucose 4,6-dehydratase
MRLLVTGGCGFIGSNFIRLVLTRGLATSVLSLDALTYAGNPENLADLSGDARYRFALGRVEDPAAVAEAMAGCEACVHFAAESHVDRSIEAAAPFLRTNVIGTQALLDAARKAGVRRFLHVSTDEVYGSLAPQEVSTEASPLRPRSPYAASKAAADHLVLAAHETFGLPVLIARPSNNYGPYQFPEKFLPLMITNAFEDRPLPIYGTGRNVREWLFVEDCCEALAALLKTGRPGEIYNVGGGPGYENLSVARRLLAALGKPESLITFVPDRPGHDLRYALDSGKIACEVGWRPSVGLEEGLARTIRWYREHEGWWRPLKGALNRETRGYWS